MNNLNTNTENNFLEFILKSFPIINEQDDFISFDELLEIGILNEFSYDLKKKLSFTAEYKITEKVREFILYYGSKGFITIDELKEILPQNFFYTDDREFNYDKLEGIISILIAENIELLETASGEENLLYARKELIARLITNNRYLLKSNDPLSMYMNEIKKLRHFNFKNEANDLIIAYEKKEDDNFSLKQKILTFINKINSWIHSLILLIFNKCKKIMNLTHFQTKQKISLMII